MRNTLKSIVLSISIFTSCGTDDNQDKQTVVEIPTSISFTSTGLFPEGIAYDDISRAFYVSSIGFGSISKVNLNGDHSIYIEDNSFVSTMGMKIVNNKLVVCNADLGIGQKTSGSTVGSLSTVSSWDLASKEKVRDIDLANLNPGAHLANDVVYDNLGNLYVTDSFSPLIYKITPDGKASVLVSDERFAVAQEGQSGLNGIVYHSGGYLIVSKYSEGKLFKIPLYNPTNIAEIQLDQSFSGIDGMALKSDNSLILIANDLMTGDGSVYQLTSDDDWISGVVSATFDTEKVSPTTLTIAEDNIYVLYSKLHLIFSSDAPDRNEYVIQRVSF